MNEAPGTGDIEDPGDIHVKVDRKTLLILFLAGALLLTWTWPLFQPIPQAKLSGPREAQIGQRVKINWEGTQGDVSWVFVPAESEGYWGELREGFDLDAPVAGTYSVVLFAYGKGREPSAAVHTVWVGQADPIPPDPDDPDPPPPPNDVYGEIAQIVKGHAEKMVAATNRREVAQAQADAIERVCDAADTYSNLGDFQDAVRRAAREAQGNDLLEWAPVSDAVSADIGKLIADGKVPASTVSDGAKIYQAQARGLRMVR